METRNSKMINYRSVQRLKAQKDFSSDVLLLFFITLVDFVVAVLFYFQSGVLSCITAAFKQVHLSTNGRETKESAGTEIRRENEQMQCPLMALLE